MGGRSPFGRGRRDGDDYLIWFAQTFGWTPAQVRECSPRDLDLLYDAMTM